MIEFIKNAIEQISQWLESLSARERRLVAFASTGMSILIFVGVLAWLNSIFDHEVKLLRRERQISEKIQNLEGAYKEASILKEIQAKRFVRSNISLFSVLQTVADSLNIALSDLNEQEVKVPQSDFTEVKVSTEIQKVSLDRFHAFVRAIEESGKDGTIKITKLQVKRRFDDEKLLNVQLIVSTWKKS